MKIFIVTSILCLSVFVYAKSTVHSRPVDVHSEVVKEAANAAVLAYNKKLRGAIYLYTLVKIVKADILTDVMCVCHELEFNVVLNKNCPRSKEFKCDKQPTDDVPVKRLYAKVTGDKGQNMTVEVVKEIKEI